MSSQPDEPVDNCHSCGAPIDGEAFEECCECGWMICCGCVWHPEDGITMCPACYFGYDEENE